MVNRAHEFMKEYHMIGMEDSIVMGISGGADSVAMLLVLCELKKQYNLSLFAVHVNHGIRKEALGDADFVKGLCERQGIPFYLFEADIPAMAAAQGKTEEEMGREYRYRCFFDVMKQVGAGTLAVAHHKGDQAETVLFHLVRGTDLSGVVGIRPVNEGMMPGGGSAIRVIRPMLCFEKQEITKWLEERKTGWCEDATNGDNSYMRNKLRNRVVPLLEEVNSQAVSHIAEFADTMAEYEAFFRHMAEEYLEANVHFTGEKGDACQVERSSLLGREPVFVRAVLYEMLVRVCHMKKDITREHIKALYQLLANQSGKKVVLPYGTEAVISYEKLMIRKCFKENYGAWRQKISLTNHLFFGKTVSWTVLLPFGGRLFLEVIAALEMSAEERKKLLQDAGNSKNNYTKFFDCDTIKDTLYIRTVESGDYFVMNEAGGRKKLSRYFIDAKMPKDCRERVIVLAVNQEVLWIFGGRRCENFKVTDDTQYILKVTYEGEKDEGAD